MVVGSSGSQMSVQQQQQIRLLPSSSRSVVVSSSNGSSRSVLLSPTTTVMAATKPLQQVRTVTALPVVLLYLVLIVEYCFVLLTYHLGNSGSVDGLYKVG